MTFDEWLEYGITHGFCSDQFCSTHEGEPTTELEQELWAQGIDPCVYVLRLGTPKDWNEDAKGWYVEN